MPSRPRPLPLLLILVLTFTSAACQAREDGSPADAAPVRGVTTVDARDLRFHPPAIEVPAGTEVTWRFIDGAVPHNVKGDGFTSDNLSRGTFSHRFTGPGEYRYTCTLHGGMDGRVVVAG